MTFSWRHILRLRSQRVAASRCALPPTVESAEATLFFKPFGKKYVSIILSGGKSERQGEVHRHTFMTLGVCRVLALVDLVEKPSEVGRPWL